MHIQSGVAMNKATSASAKTKGKNRLYFYAPAYKLDRPFVSTRVRVGIWTRAWLQTHYKNKEATMTCCGGLHSTVGLDNPVKHNNNTVILKEVSREMWHKNAVPV